MVVASGSTWWLGLLALVLGGCGTAPAVVPNTPVLPVLVPGEGVVFAATPGGTVTVTLTDGRRVSLADGTRVLTSEAVETGADGRARVAVDVEGQSGSVPNVRVVTEARVSRMPDRRYALFTAVDRCRGAACLAEVWVLRSDGQRVRVTREGGAALTVAWRPDGGQLAVGGGALHVVRTDTLESVTLHDFTSPAYAGDGTLFVRGLGDNDAVYQLGEEVTVVAEHPGTAVGGDPPAVRFDGGGRVLVVSFVRASGTEQVRIRR